MTNMKDDDIENNIFQSSYNYDNNYIGIPFINEFEAYNIPQINNPFAQKIPLKTLRDEEYIYVNSKQYFRILRRREKREKLKTLFENNEKNNKKYHHESRHKHAMNRKRGKGGRFLSKNEKENKTEDNNSTDTPAQVNGNSNANNN